MKRCNLALSKTRAAERKQDDSNVNKTKVIQMCGTRKREIQIDCQQLAQSNNVCTLVRQLQIEQSQRLVITRMAKTTTALSILKIICRNRKVNMNRRKTNHTTSLIVLIVLHACESWIVNKYLEERFLAFKTIATEQSCIARLGNKQESFRTHWEAAFNF